MNSLVHGMPLFHYRSGKNCKKRLHAAFDVIVYMAVEEPSSNVVGHHVRLDHHHWLQVNHVGTHIVEDYRLSVPMRGVNVVFVAVGKQIPADPFSLFHGHYREVAFDESVETVEKVALAEGRIAELESLRVLPSVHGV